MGKKKLSFKEIMTNYGVIIIMVALSYSQESQDQTL